MTAVHVAIVAPGRGLAQARVLARSIARFRPDWPITALVLPSDYPLKPLDPEPFTTLSIEELGDESLAGKLRATPYAFQRLKAGPVLVQVLLDRGAEAVLFLNPDTLVLADPVAIDELIARHDAVLVPRLSGELPDDGERPDRKDLAQAGDLDDGFFAVRNTEAGHAVLGWWAQQQEARSGPTGVLPHAVGHSQVAEAGVLAGTVALTRPGYGVSMWNLHQHELSRDDGGALAVDGEPLAVLRFPEFRIDRPYTLADFATRNVALDDPILESLCEGYSDDVIAAGWVLDGPRAPRPDDDDFDDELPDDDAEPEGASDELDWLGNGLRFDPRVKRLKQVGEATGETFGDLQSREGADALTRWLTEPVRFGGANGVNRYAYDIWMLRPDVAAAYPDLDAPDIASGFIGWLWVYGREEDALQDALLPARPDWVPKTAADPPNLLVTGYLRGVVGLGAAARGYTEALEAAGVPLATQVIATDPPETVTASSRLRDQEVDFHDRVLPAGEQADIHLFCINADQTETTLGMSPAEQRPNYTIGLWAWETDVIPRRWQRAFAYVDEIWTYSTWIAENIRPSSPVPVVALPIPVRRPEAGDTRVPFELPDAFRFLFTFDFYSTTVRKNPVGLIKAFTQAFAPNEGPVLVLKTINGQLRPADRALVQRAARGREDIHIIDGVVTDEELAALFEACDCYVSLHRAEGFGMTLAEAMAMAKPVICTGWSGNMDFTKPRNSYLVDYVPRRVGKDNPPYDADGTWAEPSVDHAAALMRQVWENPEEARARGRVGQRDVQRRLSTHAVGERARDRLQLIASMTRNMAVAETELPAHNWDELIGRLDVEMGAAQQLQLRPGPRGIAERGLMRALRPLRPYLAPYGGLDDTLVRTVSELAAEVQELRQAQAQSQARVRHLEYRLSRRG